MPKRATPPRSPLATWLRERQLLKGRGRLSGQASRPLSGHGELLRWCHQGRLAGGLSASLQATADEVVGPLAHGLGGEATRFKVLDVRLKAGEPMELVVQVDPKGTVERWAIEDVPGLVHNLNDLYRDEPSVAAGAVLGEFQDMWQLWVVSKPVLAELLQQPWFEPRRRAQLESLVSAEP